MRHDARGAGRLRDTSKPHGAGMTVPTDEAMVKPADMFPPV